MGKAKDTLNIQTPADIGQAIRAARKKQRLTLAQCAAANGVSMRFLSELERGKPGASIGATLKITRSLGLQLIIAEAS
ncbi:MAG TPA: hypothetical protein VJP87_01675 [Candidatus Acidoferrales bacterium]|nr:hypothetical protein [Candidatus Acidoferrales bacterium]